MPSCSSGGRTEVLSPAGDAIASCGRAWHQRGTHNGRSGLGLLVGAHGLSSTRYGMGFAQLAGGRRGASTQASIRLGGVPEADRGGSRGLNAAIEACPRHVQKQSYIGLHVLSWYT